MLFSGAVKCTDIASVRQHGQTFLLRQRVSSTNIFGMKPAEIITKLGGPTAVGEALGVTPQAISIWLAKGRIPLERVDEVLHVARDKGIKLKATDIRDDFDWAVICACR